MGYLQQRELRRLESGRKRKGLGNMYTSTDQTQAVNDYID
jgi:hypothetical protein